MNRIKKLDRAIILSKKKQQKIQGGAKPKIKPNVQEKPLPEPILTPAPDICPGCGYA